MEAKQVAMGDFAPQGDSTVSGDILEVVITGGGDATSI